MTAATPASSAASSADVPAEATVGDHAAIGDMGTAALLDRWGRMSWLCWPRFDDSPLFRRIVDPVQGGHWTVAPAVPFTARRRYVTDTNVVETVYECADGSAVAHDFAVVPADDRGPQFVRLVEGRSGTVPFRSTLQPSPGFDAGRCRLAVEDGRVHIEDRAVLVCSQPDRLDVEAGWVTADVTVAAGGVTTWTLTTPQLAPVRPSGELVDRAVAQRDGTQRWWQSWIGQAALPDTAPGSVARSALAVKLLNHASTGTLVAAPTTSLPERIGGPRNWDYRYCWLRDNALMVLALQRLGMHDESMAHWDWLAAAARGPDVSVAYTIDGGPLPAERILDHLPGHRSSTPVRVGNDAGPQRQHDVYGSVLDAAAYCFEHMDTMDRAMPEPVLAKMADLAASRWDLPDDSIWETRAGRAHHTYSMLLCWVALRHAVTLHDRNALAGDALTWARQRDAAGAAILRECWSPTLGAFTATAGGDNLDAATLTIPIHGLLPASDPRCRATRQSVTDELVDGGLVRRYRYDDGLPDTDNPFLLCTLWLADNHALDHDPDHAEELMERVLATSNDLGLLAEEADPGSHEPVGNFPQGLTHLGVITTACRIDDARRARR